MPEAATVDLFSGEALDPYSAWMRGRNPKDGFGGWALYTSGFRMAGDELVASLGDDASRAWRSHFLVYPIFFLYRHHLELQMKQIGERFASSTGRRGMPWKHGLMELWSEVRERLDEVYNGDRLLRQQYDRIEDLLEPLHALDPKGEVFRYPFDGSGSLTLSDDLSWINLQELKRQVAEVSGMLEKFV